MSSYSPKRALFDSFAEVAKALSHGSRLEILEQLAQGERSVEGLADRTGLSVANASQHLRLMQRAALLASRRDGKHVLYRLSDPSVLYLVAALRKVAESKHAAARNVIGGYFRERDALEAVSREELAARIKAGLVTVLDVRPGGRIRRRSSAEGDQYSATRAVPSPAETPEEPRNRGLLPRSFTASWHLRPLRFFVSAAGKFGAWRTDFRNGKAAGLPVVERVTVSRRDAYR